MPTSPHHRRLTGLLAGAAVLPLLLSACSSSPTAGGSTTTTRPTGSADSKTACALVPAAQVRSILGKQVGDPGIANSSVATTCTYPSTEGAKKSDAVIISFRAGVTDAIAGAEQAAVRKLHGTTTDVSGSGFTSYYYQAEVGGQTITSLVTLVGEAQVTVTSTASLDKIEALTQQIFDTFANQATSTTTTEGPTPATTTAP